METKPNFFEKFWYIFVGIALVLVLALAGLWFFNQKTLSEQQALKQQQMEEAANQQVTNQEVVPTETPVESDNQILQLENQGSSDEIAAIEKDLADTDFANIDQETVIINAELNNP